MRHASEKGKKCPSDINPELVEVGVYTAAFGPLSTFVYYTIFERKLLGNLIITFVLPPTIYAVYLFLCAKSMAPQLLVPNYDIVNSLSLLTKPIFTYERGDIKSDIRHIIAAQLYFGFIITSVVHAIAFLICMFVMKKQKIDFTFKKSVGNFCIMLFIYVGGFYLFYFDRSMNGGLPWENYDSDIVIINIGLMHSVFLLFGIDVHRDFVKLSYSLWYLATRQK